MVNKVILIGNLASVVELRHTQSGKPVGSVRLATNEWYTDGSGNRQTSTEWHNLVFWGNQAENARRILQKGGRTYIEGRLQTRSWEDRQTGERKSRTEVVVQNWNALDSRPKTAAETPASAEAPAPAMAPAA